MSQMLFLTRRMKRGYGVDLEVHEISSRLASWGHSVTVLCLETDGSLRGPYEVRELAFAEVDEVLECAGPFRPDVVTAFTSPFIEMLPGLMPAYDCWAWENGDPAPELFADEAEARQRVKRRKIDHCYPALTGVITISEFLRRDIEWPSAHVIHLGCDHAPDLGAKEPGAERSGIDRPMRVGTLMRLGRGEANYKGNDRLLTLAEMASSVDIDVEFKVMGRGTRKDAREFLAAGFEVSLNAGDEEKWRYLRSLDVFVSCSLWEGFNLPLVEAQALGTPAIAFEAGAHPEVTPLVFADIEGMLDFLRRATDPSLLSECSQAAYRWVRDSFSWSDTAARFQELVASSTPARSRVASVGGGTSATQPAPVADRDDVFGAFLVRTVKSLRNYGWRVTARKIKRRLGQLRGQTGHGRRKP